MPEPLQITPSLLAQASPAYWSTKLHEIRLGSELFSLKDHEYQTAWLESRAREIVHMKATQGGGTQVDVLRALHGMIYGRYPKGVLYLFPTMDDVGRFSKSRFGPLIEANPLSIGQFVKSGGKGTDTTYLKKIGSSFLYLAGGRLTRQVGVSSDDKESGKLRSDPADCVIFDEFDLMDTDAEAKALARMGHSKVKDRVYTSNPTIPGYGIDRKFNEGDQRFWHRRCGCGAWTCVDEEFPNLVGRKDGRGYVACKGCGRPVAFWSGPGTGEWVAKHPGRPIESYLWSQLTSVFNDPADILDEYNDPNNPNLSDTIRLRLGRPHVQKESQLTEQQVLACCGSEGMRDSHPGPCAMGLDIGREFHFKIGCRTGRNTFETVRVGRIPAAASKVSAREPWNAVHDLIQRFNVKSLVVDIRPYEHEAREFQAGERIKVLLCEYTDNALKDKVVDVDGVVVKAFRTGLLDESHAAVVERRDVLPRRCPEVEEYARQMTQTAKVLEEDAKSGVKTYRYVKISEDDHYRHAAGYFYLAAESVPVCKGREGLSMPTEAIHEYDPLAI